MLGAVIFDFDGVITDSEILHFRCFNKVLAQFDIKISKKDYYSSYLGYTDFDCLKVVTDKAKLDLSNEQIDDLIKQKSIIYEDLAQNEGQIIEGVRDCLEMLGRNDIPMAICSGALRSEIELILEQAKLRYLFKTIVSADQVSKGKPHPQPFLLALEKLNKKLSTNLSVEQCVAIEDSNWGLMSARTAGMHTVAVTNSYEAGQLKMAEKVVDNLEQLTIGDLQQLCS